MGSIIPHYLFVVCYSLDEVLQVHEMAKEIFNPKDQSENLVSQLNLTSFFVLCNGSHTRWGNQEEYMKAREKYIKYLIDRDIRFVEITEKEFERFEKASKQCFF
ncbi:TPA: hypothetical protein ROY30_005781 [Bacillus cereus]|uniref:hypothetical protein n=1 Tax=Bacillus TaxID=1386 RepID=UPI0002797E37|nr:MULTISPECIES: hypothetical protein [Bacillus]EJP82822.1 hypothetical protein IAU_05692 [Bacillus cereus IS075]EOO82328.1 hypothetical protein IGS_05909 [Bacillus cereus IS845/00]EOO91823.1 hypothetical protein IGQ_06015 [Bacillus cereus IS195]KLA04614.1 hypothetical protein B4153_5857 [Bacillus cereus]KMP93965.1 hypothetical protein TU63_00070 [Bacillus cereus]